MSVRKSVSGVKLKEKSLHQTWRLWGFARRMSAWWQYALMTSWHSASLWTIQCSVVEPCMHARRASKAGLWCFVFSSPSIYTFCTIDSIWMTESAIHNNIWRCCVVKSVAKSLPRSDGILVIAIAESFLSFRYLVSLPPSCTTSWQSINMSSIFIIFSKRTVLIICLHVCSVYQGLFV